MVGPSRMILGDVLAVLMRGGECVCVLILTLVFGNVIGSVGLVTSFWGTVMTFIALVL